MIFRIRLFLLLSLLFIVPLPTAARSAPLPKAGVAAQSNDGLDVLPGGCGGGLPSNSQQVCCVSGYVFLDGAPVMGAKVTVTNPNTAPYSRSVIVVTKNGPDSHFPYYHVDLNTDLQVKPNDQITIRVEYEGRVREIQHNTLAGGQQVDIVLPRADTPEDYTFQKTIGNQGADGQLRTPVGVAVDRTGSIYVADRDTSSIQVFYNDNSNNLFRRRWGTRGTKPGQLGNIGGIVLDAEGNVYVAHGWISKFSSTGALLDEWGARPDFGSDGVFDNTAAVAVDNAGIVYAVGGSSVNTGWLRKRALNGTWARINTRDSAGSLAFSFPSGVTVDSLGIIYVADTLNNRILKFAPDGLLLMKWDTSTIDFKSPSGMSVDVNDNIYLADAVNHRIEKLSVATGTWSTFAGTGNSGILTGQFSNPLGVTVAPSGDIYVADTFNRRVQKIASINPQQIAVAVPVGQLTPGQLTHPSGIAVDSSGNVYIGDSSNSRLQRFSPGGSPRVLVEGRGSGPSQFSDLQGVTVDNGGNIYVADGGSGNRIQKFDSNGTFITQWDGVLGIDGHPPAGAFNQPYDIAVDTNAVPATVYVTDRNNQRIIKFTNNGGFLWSKTGQDLGIGAFGTLLGIAVAPDGSVFVSDTANNRIVKLTTDGTLVGSPWNSPIDVPRTFRSPAGISVDASGNVYVMTANDKPLLKLGPDGSLRAEWSAFAHIDEGYVYGNFLTVDAQGTVYYSDEQNNRLQVFGPIGPHRPPVATITQVRTQNVIAPVTIQSGEQLYLFGQGGTDRAIAPSLSYEWSDNGVLLSTAQSPIVSLSTEGLHTISLRVYDPANPTNLSASVSTSVTVADLVPAAAWTMILYLDGDNSGTAGLAGALADLKREIAENSAVRIAVLYDGPDGDDSSYYMQQGNTLIEQKLGEVDMGDPQTLVNLISWAKRDAPAQHYYLAIADHANGLDGIAWDNHPGAGATTDYLDNGEIRRALEQSRQILGQPIDVLHLDGCLMGLIENAYQVRNLANFEVSSENLAWSAFAYAAYRAQINANTTPAELVQKVADRYQLQVQGLPYTIAALDLSQATQATTKLSTLADALRRYAQAGQTNRDQLLAIRNQAQKFDSNGNYAIETTDLYVDLDHWAELIAGGVNDATVRDAATGLRTALSTFVIAQHEHHGSGSINGIPVSLDHARGVAIYYPYQPTAISQAKYTNGDLDFVRDSAWDTYLAAGLDPLPPNQTAPQANPIAPLLLRTRIYIPLIRR